MVQYLVHVRKVGTKIELILIHWFFHGLIVFTGMPNWTYGRGGSCVGACYLTGTNTRIGLLNSRSLLGLTLVVMALAVAGKGLACMLAARLGGESWRDAAAIGTLMNARGLMELIILNIGLQNGVITPTLFTIFILMAVVTTVMASPIYLWIAGRAPDPAIDRSEVRAHG